MPYAVMSCQLIGALIFRYNIISKQRKKPVLGPNIVANLCEKNSIIFSCYILYIFAGESNVANPFGGGGSSAQMWNQQPVASQFPTQLWNQPNTTPIQGTSWNQQPNPAPGQAPAWNQPPNMPQNQQQMPAASWNQQMPGQSPAVSSWMASSTGQAPAQQSWNQQPMPSQAAFSTGNPFQMGQPVAGNAPGQSGAAFPAQQNSFGANAPFNSGQMGSSTSTVPSDANSAFANFNAPNSMNSGFAAFPIQNITSPPDSQNQAQFPPVQNGGFRPSASDVWNTDSSSSTWGTANQQPFQPNKTVNNAGVAAPSQFANWQQNQAVAPSNPFMVIIIILNFFSTYIFVSYIFINYMHRHKTCRFFLFERPPNRVQMILRCGASVFILKKI